MGRKRALTPDQCQEAIARYVENRESIRSLALGFHCAFSTMRTALLREGVTLREWGGDRRSYGATPEQATEIVQRYTVQHESMLKIALAMGITTHLVRATLHSTKAPIRRDGKPSGTREPEVLSPFLKALRELYAKAGLPSLRKIAAASEGRIDRVTVYNITSGKRQGRWSQVSTIITVLGGDPEAYRELWRQEVFTRPPEQPQGQDPA